MVTLYDVTRLRSTSPRLAASTLAPARWTVHRQAVFLVSESFQGQDLDGDGDQTDDVLHVLGQPVQGF